MKVGFHCDHLGFRGTENSTYLYADLAERLLGHEAIVVYDRQHAMNQSSVVRRFEKRFNVVGYDEFSEADQICRREQLDRVYWQKHGLETPLVTKSCPVGVHAVFQVHEPHGATYAYISDWLAEEMSGGSLPNVPYPVWMPEPSQTPEETRRRYQIPKDATLIGRHGGHSTFDLRFACQGIQTALERRPDLWLTLLNTHRCIEHPRVVYVDPIVDPVEKANWLGACDGWLHARFRGETFGLAVAEALFMGKPVLSWVGGLDRNHRRMLADVGLWYGCAETLVKLLTEFEPGNQDPAPQRAAVDAFRPETVMQKFEQVFLS